MDDYVLVEKFLDESIVNEYLNKCKKYKLNDSKVGETVQPDKKRRKDIFFSRSDCDELDSVLFTKGKEVIKNFLGKTFEFRECYKMGTYYSEDQGFYNPHNDNQGGDIMRYRQISLVICLSDINDYEGGLFKLIDKQKEFKFGKGDAIFFKSNMLHGVEPVTKGERKVIISFLFDEDGARNKMKYSSLINYASNYTQTSFPLYAPPEQKNNTKKEIPPNAVKLTPDLIVKLPENIKSQIPKQIVQQAEEFMKHNPNFISPDSHAFTFMNNQQNLQNNNHPMQINNNYKSEITHYSKNNAEVKNIQNDDAQELFSMDFHDKIISYSLWGDSELYNYGMMENAIEAKNIYPDYKLYVYHNNTCNEKIINLLKSMDNVVLIKINDNSHKATNMLWRFIPAFFSHGITLSRDADSIVNIREKAAVEEFLNSDKNFHIMRDNAGGHRYKILGGMWGARNKILHCLKDQFKNLFMKQKINDIRGWDQNWLKNFVYPGIIGTSFIHHNKGLKDWDQLENWSKEFPKTNYTYFVGGLNYFTPKTRELLGEKNERLKRNAFYQYHDNKFYLFPILPDSGPGNQMVSIKEALLISKLLNRICIIPDICDHYTLDRSGNTFFKFTDIFQIDSNSIKYFHDLNMENISKVYSINHGYFKKFLKHEKVLRYSENFSEELLNTRRIQNINHLNELKSKKEKMLIVKHLFNNVCISQCGFNGCSECIVNPEFIDLYKTICNELDYSEFIKQKAEDYIKQNDLTDFVGLHLRYPDNMNNKSLKQHTNLYDEDIIYDLLINMYGENKKIFIATNNKKQLKKSKLNKFFIYQEESNYISFIEQYICCKAEIFIMSIYNDFTKINQRHQRSTWSSFVQDYRMYKLNNYENLYLNDLI